jgi:hypothetical protein
VQKVIKVKGGLLELAKQLGNVSQACRVMGYSRESFCLRLRFSPDPRLAERSGNGEL